MEDRYRKYLEKAKSVIRTLDPKHNTATSSEVQLLRNQLQEKTKIIEHLEVKILQLTSFIIITIVIIIIPPPPYFYTFYSPFLVSVYLYPV